MRSVDTLRMFVNTFHASHYDCGEVIAMRELGKRLSEESKFSEAIEIHNNAEAGKLRNRRKQIIITPKLDQFMDLIDKAPDAE